MKNTVTVLIEGDWEDGKIYFRRKVDWQSAMRAVGEMLPFSQPITLEVPVPVMTKPVIPDGRIRCRVCRKIFAKMKTRRTHERKYH